MLRFVTAPRSENLYGLYIIRGHKVWKRVWKTGRQPLYQEFPGVPPGVTDEFFFFFFLLAVCVFDILVVPGLPQ